MGRASEAEMKAPHKAEHIFDEFSADYQAALKDDLEAIILFGSAARGDYTRNRSDINFLIVLSERGLEQLDLLTSLAAKWRKRKVATPLYMSGTEICSSLDSYPIEFLNMKRHYQIIYG